MGARDASEDIAQLVIEAARVRNKDLSESALLYERHTGLVAPADVTAFRRCHATDSEAFNEAIAMPGDEAHSQLGLEFPQTVSVTGSTVPAPSHCGTCHKAYRASGAACSNGPFNTHSTPTSPTRSSADFGGRG